VFRHLLFLHYCQLSQILTSVELPRSHRKHSILMLACSRWSWMDTDVLCRSEVQGLQRTPVCSMEVTMLMLILLKEWDLPQFNNFIYMYDFCLCLRKRTETSAESYSCSLFLTFCQFQQSAWYHFCSAITRMCIYFCSAITHMCTYFCSAITHMCIYFYSAITHMCIHLSTFVMALNPRMANMTTLA
jgi:hypothetical protein